MLRSCSGLLLVSVLLLALAEPASAQPRQRGGRVRGNAIQIDPATESTQSDQATEPQPTVEELLRRLDELEGVTELPAGRERGLALMLEDVRLGSTNFYDPSGIRYFSARLLIINLTDKAATIPTGRMVLIADDHEHTLSDAQTRLSRSMLQIGDQVQRYPPVPATVDVPPRGTASTWVVYAGIESASAVPSLRLKLDWDGGSEKLDINAYERGILGLRAERLGPGDCAALLTIGGELNTVNARSLTDQLDALNAAGVTRVVVAWGESAAGADDQVLGWLAAGTSQDMGLQYLQMPQIPVTIREFHLVQPADGRARQYFTYGAATPIHRTAEAAAAAALRTAFEAVPRDLLRGELAHGHRMSRAAALAHAGPRLGRRELPLVLAACDDPDHYVRLQALAALGQYKDPEAIDRLLQTAASTDHELSQAAIASLAGARYPAAQSALADYLDSLAAAQAVAAIDILASHPRTEWINRIAGYYQSSDPQLKLAALRALVRLGHPQIVSFLEAALGSPDPELRAEAFAQLAQRTDSRSEELALNAALRLLTTSPPDAATHALLLRTRDRRGLPALFGHLDAASGDREQLIELIAQLGGAEVVPELLQRYPQFTATEQAVVLQEMLTARSPGITPLALAGLSSRNPELIDVSTRVLTSRPDRQTVRLLVEALARAETIDVWSTICNALANVGDSEARAALLAVRDQEDRSKRDQVIGALTRIKHSSPAFQYSARASEAIEEGQSEKAEKLLDLAISFDAEYAEAYAQRGHLLLLRQNYAEARADFDRASALDPFDSLAITGRAIAIVMQGDVSAGVEQIRAAADKFVGDARFEYNAACVYGRAVEALQSSTDSDVAAERDEFQSAALRHLKSAMQLGFDMPDFIKADPDLAVLHEVPQFQELLASPPSPMDEGQEEQESVVPPGEFELDIRSLR